METLDSCLWLYTQLLNVILIWRPFMYLRHTSQLFRLLSNWKEKQNKTKILYNDIPLECVPQPTFGPGYNETIIWQISLCPRAIWTLSQCTLIHLLGYYSYSWYYRDYIRHTWWLHKKVTKLCPWFLAPFFKRFFFFSLLLFSMFSFYPKKHFTGLVRLRSGSQGLCFRPWL